jgi:hypothetical protein
MSTTLGFAEATGQPGTRHLRGGASPSGVAVVTAEPWLMLDLPFEHEREVSDGRVVQVRVESVAYDGVLAVPVMTVASPTPPG